MKTRLLLGFGALLACVMLPWIARLPKGWDWVAQYIPDQEHLGSGLLLFGAFSLLPGIVAACMALLSKPLFYLPVLTATLFALGFLGYAHYHLDLAADAQAAIALLFIPMYASALALLGGLIGWGIQILVCRLSHTERSKQA